MGEERTEAGVAVRGKQFLGAFCAADGLTARSGSVRAASQGRGERHAGERKGARRGLV